MAELDPPFPTLDDDDSSIEEARVLGRVKEGLFGAPADPVRIGRFVVLRRLGAGAMGEVFLAYDAELDRNVAIKLLRARDDDPERRRDARLQREARAIAKLAHPNVVPVFEIGRDGDRLCIVMEQVEGCTLRAWLAQTARSRGEILDAFAQAGEGLAAAHAAGIVHRDFKPDNVLVGRDGRVRVVDFGLALAAGDASITGVSGSPRAPDTAATGGRRGTPRYMAPECFRGDDIDARADEFSFCVALWEALAGRPPFSGDTWTDLVENVLAGRIEPPRGSLPSGVARVLRRGLDRDRERRYPSMRALLSALARARRAPWRTPGLVGVALCVALGAATMRDDPVAIEPCPDPVDRLEGTWDDRARARVRDARAGSAPAIVELLDGHTDRWRAAHVDACMAHERGAASADVLDRTMACLDRELGRVRLAVERVVTADDAVARRAVEVVSHLPPPAACGPLARALAGEPPLAPEQAECVAEVRELVDAALVENDAGNWSGARELAGQAALRAEACDHTAAIAEAHEALGRAQWRLHEADALPTLQRAVAAAVRSDDFAVLARAATWLSHQAGVDDGAPEQGLAWIEIAEAAAERATGRDDLRALALAYRAELLGWAGKPKEATELHRRALDLRVRLHGEDHPVIAESLGGLVTSTAEQGDWEASLAHAERARKIRERWYPARHPSIARAHAEAGRALMELGRAEQAEARYRKAIAMLEDTLGPEHVDLVQPRRDLAVLLATSGRLEDALQVMEAAERAASTADGGRRLTLLATLATARGVMLATAGDLEGAEVSFRRAVEHNEARFGRVHPNVAAALGSLCQLHWLRKTARDAEKSCGRAIDILETVEGPGHPLLAELRTHRGRSRALLGEREAARGDLERAIELADAGGATQLADVARAALGELDAG